jgi:hypothetical protein
LGQEEGEDGGEEKVACGRGDGEEREGVVGEKQPRAGSSKRGRVRRIC